MLRHLPMSSVPCAWDFFFLLGRALLAGGMEPQEQEGSNTHGDGLTEIATEGGGSKARLVSWYANPTSEQVKSRYKASSTLASEESRVWVLEVCEEWRTCHICGAADFHTAACTHPGTAKSNVVVRGFKLWELQCSADPVDGPVMAKYWYSNLDARPDNVDESDGMRVGEQRFTAWHRKHVKFNLVPGHWVRVQVSAGSKMHKKTWLRYVTIVDELAERDRAYMTLALAPAIHQSAVAPKSKKSLRDKKGNAPLELAAERALRGPVVGPLGGASGEAVPPEEVVVVGVSARGRPLKRREVVTLGDSDEDFTANAPNNPSSKAATSNNKVDCG